MKRFIILSLLLVLNHSILLGCSCVTLQTDTLERIADSDVIVSGTVLSKSIEDSDPADTNFRFKRAVYRMVVTGNYGKGRFADTIEIVTGLGGGDCGFEFIPGRSYIVFTSGRKRKLWKRHGQIATSICTLTSEYSEEFHKKIVSVKHS